MHSPIHTIQNKRILVIGDIMLDVYLHGTASRISPEAPVPVVVAESKDLLPGGAANVMNNLQSLGCQVIGAGFVGKDEEGNCLINYLSNLHVNTECILRSSQRTINKTRVLANGQHIVRCDFDSDFAADPDDSEMMLSMLGSLLSSKHFDAILVSDYAKGTVTSSIMDLLRQSQCPIICDLKPHHKSMFNHVWSITPNLQEARGMLGDVDKFLSPTEVARRLKQEMNLNTIVITLSDDGVLCIDENDDIFTFPAHVDVVDHDPKHRLDVTGAGDTAVSVFAACVAAGFATREAVFIANVAAGIVVRKIGTATCSLQELDNEMEKTHDRIATKI